MKAIVTLLKLPLYYLVWFIASFFAPAKQVDKRVEALKVDDEMDVQATFRRLQAEARKNKVPTTAGDANNNMFRQMLDDVRNNKLTETDNDRDARTD